MTSREYYSDERELRGLGDFLMEANYELWKGNHRIIIKNSRGQGIAELKEVEGRWKTNYQITTADENFELKLLHYLLNPTEDLVEGMIEDGNSPPYFIRLNSRGVACAFGVDSPTSC